MANPNPPHPSSVSPPLWFPETPWDFPDRALKELFSDLGNLRDLVDVAAPDYAPYLDCLHAAAAKTEEIASLIPGWPKFLSDLVFDVPIIDPNAEPGDHLPLGVLVVENQSKAESDVIPRAFSFIAGKWMRRLREWDGRVPFEDFGLPAATSIIVYTGLAPWKGPRTITDLIKGPIPIRKASPRFDPVFWEVRDYTADQLLNMNQELFRGMAVIRAQSHSLKTFRKVFGSALEGLKDLAKADRMRWAKLVQFVMWWSFHRRNQSEREQLRNTVAAVYNDKPVDREANLMAETIAEYYYRQGESSGFMSGKAEDQRSLLEALNEAISERFSKTIDQEIAERLLKAPSSDPKAFIKWSVILGQSKTWDDFLKRTGWNDLK